MDALITLLPGDGIGPEVTAAGHQVLKEIAHRFSHEFEYDVQLIGGAAMETSGSPLPEQTAASCEHSDAILLGAVGGPKWSDPNATVRPEQGLLGLRSLLGVYANVRPVKCIPALADASPLKKELLQGVDIVVVRELTGGIYFGEKTRSKDAATDVCTYTRTEVERVVRFAADLAMHRGGRLCSVDKANVLETSRLWRDETNRLVNAEYAELELETLLVDAAAMHLLSRPADFDVLVTENMFGDILTDEVSMLSGSLGMLPSASLGSGKRGLYEPIHGSAPDIAGRNKANPCGMIASVALLLRHSLGLDAEASAVEEAISKAIEKGARTADLARGDENSLSTREMTARIIQYLP